ncbi:MAG: glycosyltransferase family 2 protein [Spirosomataceae bacterium]
MKVSIALCTYNGEKYLSEQLESLLKQTRPADEIVICDDQSKDDTERVVRGFEDKLPIRFFKNESSLRVVKNFEKAANLCTGDIIFFCDQDDVWEKDKIQVMLDVFSKNDSLELLFSNAELVNGELEPLEKDLWQSVRFWKQQQTDFQHNKEVDILLQGNRVTGCTMAVRRRLIEEVTPFPENIDPEFIHDYWLAVVAAHKGTIGIIDQKLVKYRQHASQYVGIAVNNQEPIRFWDRFNRPREVKIAPFQNKARYFMALEGKLKSIGITNTEKLKAIAGFYEKRASLPKGKINRVLPAGQLLLSGKYHQYKDIEANSFAPFLAFLGDILE